MSLKNVSRNRKAPGAFSSFKQESRKTFFQASINAVVSVYSWIGKTTMRKESCSGKSTPRNIRKILFTFFLFSYNQHNHSSSEISTTLKLKTKNILLEIISPSFSMLNFHFRTQTKILLSSRVHTSVKPVTNTTKKRRCACNDVASWKENCNTELETMTKEMFSTYF